MSFDEMFIVDTFVNTFDSNVFPAASVAFVLMSYDVPTFNPLNTLLDWYAPHVEDDDSLIAYSTVTTPLLNVADLLSSCLFWTLIVFSVLLITSGASADGAVLSIYITVLSVVLSTFSPAFPYSSTYPVINISTSPSGQVLSTVISALKSFVPLYSSEIVTTFPAIVTCGRVSILFDEWILTTIVSPTFAYIFDESNIEILTSNVDFSTTVTVASFDTSASSYWAFPTTHLYWRPLIANVKTSVV